MIDPDEVADLKKPRRAPSCQCDGAAVGPCPGPLNCPYSGLAPEDDEPEKEEENEEE